MYEILKIINEEIENFGTKIVDKNGQKLIMYQGRSKKGLTSLVQNGQGWFSRYRGVGVQFADMIKHIALINKDKEKELETIPNDELSGYVYSAYLNVYNPYYVDIKKTLWDRTKENDEINFAKQNGYDGVVILANNEIKDVIVFSDYQIKRLN